MGRWRRTVCSLKRLRFDSTIINLQIKWPRVIKISMKYAPLATLTFISIFLAVGEMYAQSNTALDDAESVTVYPSIEVVVNKAIVVRLLRKATKVAVTQPQIAEVVVVAPDQLLINGKAVGATSVVVWYEQKSPKQ